MVYEVLSIFVYYGEKTSGTSFLFWNDNLILGYQALESLSQVLWNHICALENTQSD